jgi:hypothetical protein
MKRGPGINVEVPGRWEAETEARLIEFVKNVRDAENQDEAEKLFTQWLQSSHNEKMRNTDDRDITGAVEKVRAVSTEEEAANELRRIFPPLTGDRLYGELADMAEGKGVGAE